MKRISFFTLLIIGLISCEYFKKEKPKSIFADKINMMEADRAFSKFSEKTGMKNAFLEFIDSNGVLLRPNNLPLVGANAIDYLIQQNDTSFILKWEPQYGEVAQSGDLGYTYGIYALKPNEKDTVIYGTYVSIWKKETSGKWKYVLGSGNKGIGELQEE